MLHVSVISPCMCICVDDLRLLTNLQVLDLRHNKFKEIPSVVYELPALQTLYLRCNKIKVVHPDIGKLKVSDGTYCSRSKTSFNSIVSSKLSHWISALSFYSHCGYILSMVELTYYDCWSGWKMPSYFWLPQSNKVCTCITQLNSCVHTLYEYTIVIFPIKYVTFFLV